MPSRSPYLTKPASRPSKTSPPKRPHSSPTKRPAVITSCAEAGPSSSPPQAITVLATAATSPHKQIGSAEKLVPTTPTVTRPPEATEAWSLYQSRAMTPGTQPPGAMTPSRAALLRELHSQRSGTAPASGQHPWVYMHSPHGEGSAAVPYRPLSVVPQRPRDASPEKKRTRSGTMVNYSGTSPPLSPDLVVRAQPVRWANHARRRALSEHDKADEERQVTNRLFDVHIDRSGLVRGIAAAREKQKKAAALAVLEKQRLERERLAREKKEAEEAARAERARIRALPPIEELPVTAILKFKAEHDIEINLEEGEELSALDVQAPDGWLLVKNRFGKQGLVPESYLKTTEEYKRDKAAALKKAQEKEAANKPVADWGGRFAGGDSRGFANAAAPAPAAAKTKGKKK